MLRGCIFFYQEPMERWHFVYQEIAGQKVKVKEKYMQKEIDGKKMYKTFCTMQERYNVDFVFCTKSETGKKIVEILSNDNR